MPNPSEFKDKDAFISACIRTNIKEGLTKEQAAGKCYGMWENKSKSIKKAMMFNDSLYADYFSDNPYTKLNVKNFDEGAVKLGIEEETKEHYDQDIPDIKKIIGKIVLDHLNNNPNYYKVEEDQIAVMSLEDQIKSKLKKYVGLA